MHRLPPLPTLPRPPARISIPVVAIVAPIIGAVVIGLMTRSPFVLVFAVLSPLIAIATVLDGRRTARRVRRDEAARFDRECLAYDAAITRAHAEERAHADARYFALTHAVDTDGNRLVRVGVGPAVSAVAPDEVFVPGDSGDEARLRGMLARARRHDSLPVLVPRGAIAVRGRGAVADALVRRLELEPGVELVRLHADEHPDSAAIVLHVQSATCVEVTVPGGAPVFARPEFVSRPQLAAVRSRQQAHAEPALPPVATWRALRAASGPSPGAGVTIGVDAGGPVLLDLEREGPHALVGGTTGSGKSEFLRSFALGCAADRAPSELQLLFVDFKGGATFAGLTELPHAVGLVTDLDPLVAERALLSLQAELRRRERVLVEAGVRDIAQRPQLLTRLVVLVDEFAALMDAFPELHAPFADLSARGRSLGVHLVLCTQNPAAAVRDAVAGNCAVRVAFRLSASAAAGFIGAAGREIATAPAGRAMIVTADGARVAQIATIDDDDIEAVQRRWADAPRGSSPWLPPLPTVVSVDDLDAADRDAADRDAADRDATTVDATHDARVGNRSTVTPKNLSNLAFGLLDDPSQQRRLLGVWNPARDGGLAVVGAPRSGRTTALAALADAARRAGASVAVLPSSVPEAWALLEALAAQPPPGGLLLADDLDQLLADAGELAPELVARWDSAVRVFRRAGGGVAACVGPASSARSLLGSRFESRLVLRCVDADDHLVAGAPRGLFDRSAPAGRGWWNDRQVHVATVTSSRLVPTGQPAEPWSPPVGSDVILVARQPVAVATAVLAKHPKARVVLELANDALGGSSVALTPRIFVADPEAWQAAWGLFSSLRRASPIVVVRGDPTDLRALLGQRATPPPLDPGKGEVWVAEPGEPVRRRRWAALAGN